MTSEDHLDSLLEEAKNIPPAAPSADLVARVLADASAEATKRPPVRSTNKPRFLARLLAPIGGMGGVFALGACAAIGILVGTSYANTSLSIPVLDDMLAAFSDSTDATSPFETLSLLMTET